MTPIQQLDASERVNFDTPDKANSMYIAGLQVPLKDDSPNFEALEIGNYILGGGSLSSRLADRIRKKDGLSYGVASVLRGSSLEPRTTMMMYAISNPVNTEKVVAGVAEEVQRLLKDGVTQEELEAARESFLKTRQGKRANDGSLAALLVKNLQADRTTDFQAASDARFKELTKDQVDETLRKYLDPDRLFIVTAGDFSKVSEESEEAEEKK